MLEKYLQIHPEVRKSISAGEPVVALGSDIISRNVNYPQGIKIANDICKIIRNCGAVPATIAIIDGILKVGLTEEEIELLSLSKNIANAGRKDLPFIISKKQTCSTTIAASMILASLAGIKVLATSSIGGVSRKSQDDFNIYADLHELTNTNVAVICSGINSILDIESTLKYLNVKGVPVIGYKTNELPVFYEMKRGFTVDYNVNSSLDISKALKAKWDLNLNGGVIVANPITNKSEINYNLMNTTVDIQLLHNNSKLAADIARNLSNLYKTKL